jgi:hypothetical protein
MSCPEKRSSLHFAGQTDDDQIDTCGSIRLPARADAAPSIRDISSTTQNMSLNALIQLGNGQRTGANRAAGPLDEKTGDKYVAINC